MDIDDRVRFLDEIEVLQRRLYRSEHLNAELARMLATVEWNGVNGECPNCRFSSGEGGHAALCALAALLKKARTE